MTTQTTTNRQARVDNRRWRLAGNDNETIAQDDAEDDTEAHRLAGNDNETIVPSARVASEDADSESDDVQAQGLRRLPG